MTPPPSATIEPRKLLVSGGVGAGLPRTPQARPLATGPDITPAPADESPAGREDWHAEVLGATWLRVP